MAADMPLAIDHFRVEFAHAHPLADEVVNELSSPRVNQHSLHLTAEYAGSAELLARRQIEQLR